MRSSLPPERAHFSLRRPGRKTCQLFRKYAVAAVDPGHGKWQPRQHSNQRMTYMTPTKQRDWLQYGLKSLP